MNEPYRPAAPIEFPRTNDEKNVRLLALFHYAAAALTALLSSFFIAHIVMGVMMVRGPSDSSGYVLIGMGSAVVLLGWTMAALIAYAGRSIAARKRHTFCLVVAGLSCLFMPFGTALGIFTIVLLTKAPVRTMFGESTVARTETPAPQTPAAPSAELPGWVSAEGKRRFTRRVAVVLGGLVFSQALLMVGSMAYSMGNIFRTPWRTPELSGAQQREDRIWYVERQAKPRESSGDRHARLASIRVDDDEVPEAGLDLPSAARSLAIDGSALWAIGGNELARYENGKVSTYASEHTMYWPTPAFSYDNRPAVFDWRGSREIVMLQPDGDAWRDVPGESWRTSHALAQLPNLWAVLPSGTGFDVFMQFGSELRWRHIVTGDPLDDPHVWDLVNSNTWWWAPAQIDGKAAIVQTVHSGFDSRLQLVQQTEHGWTAGWSVKAQAFGPFAAMPLEDGKLRLVLGQVRGIETLDISATGSVLSRHVHANPVLPVEAFGYRFMIGLNLGTYLLTALAAAILTRLMRRDRTDVLSAAGRQVRFASLLQRAAARGIDQALGFAIMLPWVWPWVRAPMTQAMWPSPTMSAKSILVPLAGLAISWLVALLLTSWMEGRWGVSPGKWLLRIKVVGTDLMPCGFVRALVRNVLVMADAMLSFTLGMLFVACSRNWQRIGDIAGRTVVVRSQVASV